jgi:SAM-dependent methyltransferase
VSEAGSSLGKNNRVSRPSLALRRQRRHVRDWDELADVDPVWAVLASPAAGRRWQLDEFFRTGAGELSGALDVAGKLGRPHRFGAALDFGCGLGRLTRALAERFDEAVGVDVSARMLAQARRLNADRVNCRFVLTEAGDLGMFAAGSFDLVYSSIVLQHLPTRTEIERCIGELVRVVSPEGVVVFQLPSAIGLRYRVQLRRRAYATLRRLGVSPAWLYRHDLNPIRVRALSEARVAATVERAGGAIVCAVPDASVPQLPGRRYFVTRTPGR